MSVGQYPALGFDPAPGVVANVQSLADTLGTVAKDLGEAHFALTSISKSDSVWEGKASEAFHGRLGELPGYLDKANRSLGDASNALHGWVTDLSSMQRTAGDYERQAAQALQAVEKAQANPDLGLAGQFFDDEQRSGKPSHGSTRRNPSSPPLRASWR